ncbi:hypothetical protein J3E68DRAFT_203068 [Trichoderma sp. SZMC 28012]
MCLDNWKIAIVVPFNGIRFAGWLSLCHDSSAHERVQPPLCCHFRFISRVCMHRNGGALPSSIRTDEQDLSAWGRVLVARRQLHLRGSLADTLNMDLLISLLLVSNERDSTAPRGGIV